MGEVLVVPRARNAELADDATARWTMPAAGHAASGASPVRRALRIALIAAAVLLLATVFRGWLLTALVVTVVCAPLVLLPMRRASGRTGPRRTP
ncbi:hypothetical protein [Naasia sp. SYSU D00948]|uniref:hypothetical protein n=1 Tax=Naasia sp. SYSU D00948 TaxID=2817379 RepID=UPI001B30EFB4|nr:hypothetical protein [Naasia sp. SYSU D00948]